MRDKVICVLVCRNWCQVIYSTNLYSELSFQSVSKFNQAMSFFESNLYMAQLIKQLTFSNDCYPDTSTILTLPNLFPNVEVLNLQYYNRDASINMEPQIRQQGSQEWSNLKQLKDYPDTGISRFLLGSSSRRNLQ